MSPSLSQLIDQFSLEVYIVDADTLQILFMNSAAETNIGYKLSELKNQALVKVSPQNTVEYLKSQMSVLRTDPELKEIILGNIITRKDGSRYPIDARIQFVEYEGRPAYIGIIQDASDKQIALDQLHYVLKGSQLAFWDWNIEKNTYFVDDRWLEILGYEQDGISLTPDSAAKFIHADDKDKVIAMVEKFILYDDNFSVEFRGVHKNDKLIWIRSSASVVTRDLNSGRPLRICGTHEDITKYKLGQLEREQFFKFFQISSDIMMIGKLDGSFSKVNPASIRILGFSEEELLNMKVIDLVHPEDREMTRQEHAEQAKTGGSLNFENRCLCKDGTYRWLSWRANFDKEDNNSYATATDITESKKIQAQLRQQQDIYTSLVENTEDVICTFNHELQHIYVNPSACKVWNKSAEEFIGKTRREMGFPEELCKQWEIPLNKVLTTAKPFSMIFDSTNTRTPSRIYWYAFPGHIEDGEVKSIFTIARDITEYMKSEVELRKMHKLNSLGVLAGGIAHDFNNILTVLFGNIALAKSRIPQDHKSYPSLEQAEKAFHRATHLTSQLLTFAKGGDPVKQDISINSLIEEVVLFDLSGSNVKPAFESAPDLWKARVDKGQISQVFSNLTTNANQAMPNGGHLYIKIENANVRAGDVPGLAAGKFLKFTIRDEGTGIKNEHIEMIFDPYFSTKQKGSGLGLATVYSIVTKHGGYIAVQSQVDAGATFIIYLPASDSHLSSFSNETEIAESSEQASSRILIMDDEEMICELSSNYLTSQGYHVETAKDGREAISLYTAALDAGKPFDCVIMDLTIPGGMSGKDALVEILKIHPSATAIVSSGYAADPVMANYLDHGFKGCISKPFYIRSLQEEIIRVLENS